MKKIVSCVLVIGLMLALVMACAKEPAPAPKPAGLSEADAMAIATEAYIYGYPLVTMEMTRRVMTNVAKPEGTHGPMGQFVKMRDVSDGGLQGCHGPQRRHALHRGLGRCLQGALGPQHPRHEGPLFPVPHAVRLDRRVPGPRQAHHRHQGPDLCHHGSGLDGYAAGGRHGV